MERLAVAQTQCAATQVSLRFEPASPLQPWLSLATFFSPSASLLLSASVPPGKPAIPQEALPALVQQRRPEGSGRALQSPRRASARS